MLHHLRSALVPVSPLGLGRRKTYRKALVTAIVGDLAWSIWAEMTAA